MAAQTASRERAAVLRSRCLSLAHLTHELSPVAAEIVHDHHVVCRKRRHQHPLDIGPKARAVHCSVEKPGGVDAIHPQGGDEGHGVPMAIGDLGRESGAAW